ncbi:putative phosphatidylinositol-3,4,5-trisphosphate 3-phosphatase [Aspergillus affinis]|uniref:putative phosphatidylinositol-3,4,5-trisphosphate 3-phosphatase n=1 Tax=Aspergillus affinis TaxID=1070780 RepID=UPI0022FE53BF|nr:phosphatases II [Aspergillus affinis]KAI9042885.1 phosphatases II [Aspergillus affinis]
MASILRQIVAGPRQQHPEANLDLCYVTDNGVLPVAGTAVIATSGPSSNYPQRAYRNPLDELVNFLDAKHGENWCIWEFRAEGTGYPDEEVYGRIHHYPFPDHHPPPFVLIPAMMGSLKNWLQRLDESEKSQGQDKGPDDEKKGKRVAVVHCKAGKGRSGTVACSYLISQEGWKIEDALQRFTERRMRAGFGHGVSIPSQLRWVRYVDRWANQMDRKYIERPVEILEVHVWGLRDGVKVAVEGFIDEGKKIKNFHLFHRNERTVVENGKKTPTEDGDKAKSGTNSEPQSAITESSAWSSQTAPSSSFEEPGTPSKRTRAVIFRPSKPVIVPTSDVNIDFERRSKAAYTGWAMATSIAHVWFNTYFEGGDNEDSGVFEIEWDAMDGIKGTSKKGTRALDRLKVVWRYPTPSQLGIPKPTKESTSPISGQTITEPKPGETAPESSPADWRGQETGKDSAKTIRNQENIPINLEPVREGNQPRGGNQGEGGDESQSNNQSYLGVITATAASATTTAAHSLQELGKELGLRQQTAESQDVSLAESDDNSSVLGRRKGKATDKKEGQDPSKQPQEKDENGDFEGTQPYFANGKNSNGIDASSGKKDG